MLLKIQTKELMWWLWGSKCNFLHRILGFLIATLFPPNVLIIGLKKDIKKDITSKIKGMRS